MTWTDNANNEHSVQVQRATDLAFTTGFTSVVVSGSTLAGYTDNSVSPNTTYHYRVRSANVLGWSATFSNTATVTTAAEPLSITTTSLPTGAVNAAYSNQVNTFGGIGPFNWSATGLPVGLSINPSTGLISGSTFDVLPTAAFADFSVSITVEDSAATTFNKILTLRINQVLPAAPSDLSAPSATSSQVALTWTDNANNEHSVQVQRATNLTFTTGLTNVLVSGSTLTGYTDNSVSPNTTYYYRVRSANVLGWSATFSSTATVTTAAAALSITNTSLPTGSVNAAYSNQVNTLGGIGPFNWSATGLPVGLSINASTGLISGSTFDVLPTSTFANFSVNITVEDSTATIANKTLNLRINQVRPAGPSGLSATATGPTQITLVWTDNANNEHSVQVQRATNIGFTSGLKSVIVNGTNVTGYIDNTVVTGTTYYYRVRSANVINWSSTFSNTSLPTTP